jgi:hypothetical protein
MSPAVTNATITLTTEVENVMLTLTDILDRESDAVQASDFRAFRDIQSDKFAMLSRYRSLMDTLQRQSASLSLVDSRVIDRLRASSEKFRLSTDRNAKALDSGRASIQRIVDRIVRTARDTIHANRQTYNRKGYADAKTQIPVSIQVNEVL